MALASIHCMKRFVNTARRTRPAHPRIITAQYRVVGKHEAASAAAAPQPLKPADSFSELAARAYAQSRASGADTRMNAVA